MWRDTGVRMRRRALGGALGVALGVALCAVVPTAQAQPAEYDPSVLGKLRDGRLQEISPSSRGRIDLLAIVRAFGDANCVLDVQSRARVPELIRNATAGIRSEDAATLAQLQYHPTYGRTQVMLSQHGCDGPVVRQVATNLVRGLENPPQMPPARLLRQDVVHWAQAGFTIYGLSAAQRAALERELDDTQVLQCSYRNTDPGVNSQLQVTVRTVWHRSAPARAGAWSGVHGHPMVNMGTLALDACPDTEQAFEAARDAAQNAAGRRPSHAAGGDSRSARAGAPGRPSIGCRNAQSQLAAVEAHGRSRPDDRTADWADRVEELRDAVRQKCGGG